LIAPKTELQIAVSDPNLNALLMVWLCNPSDLAHTVITRATKPHWPQAKAWRCGQDSLGLQIYLGDEDFVTRMQALVNPAQSGTVEVPRTHRQIKRTLAQWLKVGPTREQALRSVYKLSGINAKMCYSRWAARY
jgi:hypothetical protein